MFGLLSLLLSLLAVYPAAGNATVTSASTDFSTGTMFAFSQINAAQGTISTESGLSYSGDTAALATYDGTGLNGYARGIWNVNWEDGDDVWFGAAYYLPTGFLENVLGQVDLLRWDNWTLYPHDADWGGVSIWGSDHKARLLRFGANRPVETLVGPIKLPEGEWFTIQVHQVRSDVPGQALSELYYDGRLVGRSTAANTYGRPGTRVRFGIVAMAEAVQTKPLALYFDDPSIGPEPPAELARPTLDPEPDAPRSGAPEAGDGDSGGSGESTRGGASGDPDPSPSRPPRDDNRSHRSPAASSSPGHARVGNGRRATRRSPHRPRCGKRILKRRSARRAISGPRHHRHTHHRRARGTGHRAGRPDTTRSGARLGHPVTSIICPVLRSLL